jgi:hypothetical protein
VPRRKLVAQDLPVALILSGEELIGNSRTRIERDKPHRMARWWIVKQALELDNITGKNEVGDPQSVEIDRSVTGKEKSRTSCEGGQEGNISISR